LRFRDRRRAPTQSHKRGQARPRAAAQMVSRRYRRGAAPAASHVHGPLNAGSVFFRYTLVRAYPRQFRRASGANIVRRALGTSRRVRECWMLRVQGIWTRLVLAGVIAASLAAMPGLAQGRVRTGARCNDGTTSSATGSGACSHHRGVACWIYSDGTCTKP
jgi:hypothetical protein